MSRCLTPQPRIVFVRTACGRIFAFAPELPPLYDEVLAAALAPRAIPEQILVTAVALRIARRAKFYDVT